MAISLIAAALGMLLTSVTGHALATASPVAICTDAGSSATRGYKLPEMGSDWVPSMVPIGPKFDDHGVGGIHYCTTDLACVERHLQHIVEFAKTSVPESVWSTTQLFLMGTGGLRQSQHGDATLALIQQVLSRPTFHPFVFKPEFASIITGEEEGQAAYKTVQIALGGNPALVVDLGGATGQFATPIASASYYPHFINSISTAIGANKVEMDLLNDVPADSTGTRGFVCYPRGFEKPVPGTNVTFVGTGNFTRCLDAMSKLHNRIGDATLQHWFQDHPIRDDGPVVAIQGYAFVARALGINVTHNFPVSLREFKHRAEKMCSHEYGVMKAIIPNSVFKADELHSLCFRAAHIIVLFRDHVRLDMNRPIRFATHIDGSELGWALAAAIARQIVGRHQALPQADPIQLLFDSVGRTASHSVFDVEMTGDMAINANSALQREGRVLSEVVADSGKSLEDRISAATQMLDMQRTAVQALQNAQATIERFQQEYVAAANDQSELIRGLSSELPEFLESRAKDEARLKVKMVVKARQLGCLAWVEHCQPDIWRPLEEQLASFESTAPECQLWMTGKAQVMAAKTAEPHRAPRLLLDRRPFGIY